VKTQEKKQLRHWRSGLNNPSKYRIGVDDDVRCGKSHSAFIQSVDIEPDDFECFLQTFGAGAYRGKRIKFTALVKTKKLEGRAGLFLNVLDAGRITLAYDETSEREDVTSQWAKHTIVVDVPSTARYINFGSILRGSGRLCVADLTIEQAGSDDSTTGQANPTVVSEQIVRGADLSPEKVEVANSSMRLDSLHSWNFNQCGNGLYDYAIDRMLSDGTAASFIRSQSEQIPGQGEQSSARGSLSQSISAAAYRGKRVRFAGSIKPDQVSDWCGLGMSIEGKKDETLAYTNMYRNPISGSSDWIRSGVVLDVPPEAQSISVWANLNGKGCVWFCRFSLEEAIDHLPTDSDSMCENLDFSSFV